MPAAASAHHRTQPKLGGAAAGAGAARAPARCSAARPGGAASGLPAVAACPSNPRPPSLPRSPATDRLPFYSVAKLGFIAALWHPSTKLAASLYTKGIAPLLSR